MTKIEKVARQLDDEAREMWSQGKISGEEALAVIHFIEKFKTLLTPTTKQSIIIIMNNYIEAVCIGKPLDLPEYNEDTEQWEVHFEESPTPWHPYDNQDLISYSCESADEACELYNYYNQNPVKEINEDEETSS